MTKAERVAAALARKAVDYPPVSFWRHVPDMDATPHGLAEAMLAFQRRFDLDFIKVMSSGVYCVEDWGCRVAYTGTPHGNRLCLEHAVRTVDDWKRITRLDIGAGALGRELDAVRLVIRGRADDAPVVHTLFSPLTIARKLAGDRLLEDLRQNPEAVLAALEVITETTARYAEAALDTGADGIFFATQTATADTLTRDELATFQMAHDRRVLEAVKGKSSFTILHVHGTDIYFDELASLPAHAISWHDRLTPPTLAVAQRRRAGAVVGGLNEETTLRRGSLADIAAEVDDAVGQTGGLGLIVSPGCVLKLDVPVTHLEHVVRSVRRVRS